MSRWGRGCTSTDELSAAGAQRPARNGKRGALAPRFLISWERVAGRWWRSADSLPSRHDHELVASILLPAALVVLLAYGLLLAVAGDVDAFFGDAVVDEVLLGDLRAAHGQREIVLIRAALVDH